MATPSASNLNMSYRQFVQLFPITCAMLFSLLLLWVWGVTPTACGVFSLDLPSTGVTSVPLPAKTLDISINRAGDTFVGSKFVTPEDLGPILTGLALNWGDRPVVISADSRTSYRQVAAAAQSASDSGFQHLYFRTNDQHISSLLFRQAHASGR